MPRPKLPAPRPPVYNIFRVVLSEDDGKYLVALAGLKKNSEKAKTLLAEVEKVLTFHQVWLEELDHAPRPHIRLATLRRVHAQILGLYKTIGSLPLPLIGFDLWEHWRAARDRTRKSLVEVANLLEAKCQELRQVVPDGQPLRGRPRERALSHTMRLLLLTYSEFRCPEENENEFISVALQAANIPHPDPSEQPSRFKRLICPPYHARSSPRS